jgi:PAS domain-containing protein
MFYHNEFKKIRENKKISRASLARKIGKSDRTLERWENGINIPNEYNIRIIAKTIGIPVTEISDLSEKSDIIPLYYDKLGALDKSTYDFTGKTETEKQQLLIRLQKQVEVLLWESKNHENDRQYYTELINSFNFFVYAKDKQLRYTYINNYFASYFNFPDKSIVYRKRNNEIWEHKYAWEELTELEKKVKDTGISITDVKIPIHSTSFVKGTGLATIKPVFDSSRKVTGVTGTILDVTSEELAKEKYFYMESIFDKLDDVIWILKVKPYKHYLYINDAFERIFKIKINEMHSNIDKWQDLVIEEDKKNVKNALNSFSDKFIYRIKRADGNIRTLQHNYHVNKVRDEEFIFGVIRDITDQKISVEQNEYDKKVAYEKGWKARDLEFNK